MLTSPLLAATIRSDDEIQYPCLATPKIDGIRCLKLNGKPLTRSFKDVQNIHIRNKIIEFVADGADGELLVPGGFNATQSAVMKRTGTPHFYYYVFDHVDKNANGTAKVMEPYSERVLRLHDLAGDFVIPVVPSLVNNHEELLDYEKMCIDMGYEGVMLRKPDGRYKCGRSTLDEFVLAKLKRYQDSEAVILSLIEATQNLNPIVEDNFGYATRPGSAENREPKGIMGAMQVRDIRTGIEFEIGTGKGLTLELRKYMWENPALFIGRIVNYVHQAHGAKDRPRFPSFRYFREQE